MRSSRRAVLSRVVIAYSCRASRDHCRPPLALCISMYASCSRPQCTDLCRLQAGEHIVAQSSLYGGTFGALTHDFTDLGIAHTLVSAQDPSAWAAALRPETRVFYAEAITNPLLEVSLSLAQPRAAMHGGTNAAASSACARCRRPFVV